MNFTCFLASLRVRDGVQFLSFTLSPGAMLDSALASSIGVLICESLTALIRSSGCRPAWSAALPGTHYFISAHSTPSTKGNNTKIIHRCVTILLPICLASAETSVRGSNGLSCSSSRFLA